MSSNTDDILNKIKKCLNLSKSSNANEAAAALRQAQALMRKYSLDENDVLAAEVSTSAVNSTVKKSPAAWESNLSYLSAEAFGCRVLFFQGGIFTERRAEWLFVGTGINPKLASYAFCVLLRQIRRDRTDYIKTKLYRCKQQNKTSRADLFCEAWVNMARDKVSSFAGNTAAIDAYLAKKHPSSKKLKPRESAALGKATASDDIRNGHFAGKNAVLNKPVDAGVAAKRLASGG